MKLAVFTVSLPEWTPEQAVQRLAAQGWDGIEFRVVDAPPAGPDQAPGFWSGNRCTVGLSEFAERAPQLARMVAGAGLGLPSVGAYPTCDQPADVELALRGTAALGAAVVRVRTPALGSAPYPELFDRARRLFPTIADRAGELGVKVVVELHHGTVVSSPSAALRLLDGLDPAHIGVLHDVGNMLAEGNEDVLSGLQMLGPYLAHVHVKNGQWSPGPPRGDGTRSWSFDWTPMAEGQADLPALFAALRSVGYDGWVSSEDFSTAVPLEERTAGNLALLRSLAAGG